MVQPVYRNLPLVFFRPGVTAVLLSDSILARAYRTHTHTLWPLYRPCTDGKNINPHQVEQFLQAAREDEIGRYAVGAMERVIEASEEATKTIKSSTTR